MTMYITINKRIINERNYKSYVVENFNYELFSTERRVIAVDWYYTIVHMTNSCHKRGFDLSRYHIQRSIEL